MLIGLDGDMTLIDIEVIRSRSEGSVTKKGLPSLSSELLIRKLSYFAC